MKFYCKNCGSIFELGVRLNWNSPCQDWSCPMCEDYGTVERIPDHETPEQYEKRTGKALPNNGAVFFIRNANNPYYDIGSYEHAKQFCDDSLDNPIVVADPPVPPPVGWKPEEVA